MAWTIPLFFSLVILFGVLVSTWRKWRIDQSAWCSVAADPLTIIFVATKTPSVTAALIN